VTQFKQFKSFQTFDLLDAEHGIRILVLCYYNKKLSSVKWLDI